MIAICLCYVGGVKNVFFCCGRGPQVNHILNLSEYKCPENSQFMIECRKVSELTFQKEWLCSLQWLKVVMIVVS